MENRDKLFVDATRDMENSLLTMSTRTPNVRPGSEANEFYLTNYFTEDIKSKPLSPHMQQMNSSVVYWYCKKYKRTHLFDPFTLGGERLLGAILAGCEYTGSATYYPMHVAYRAMIDSYGAVKPTTVVRTPYYKSVPAQADIVFAYIPNTEDHCIVLSRIWKSIRETVLVVLHYSTDNVGQLTDVLRMIESLPDKGADEQPIHLKGGDQVVTLSRSETVALSGTLQAANVYKDKKGRTVYKLKHSCVFLAIPRYIRALGSDMYYIVAQPDSSSIIDFAKALGPQLTLLVTGDTFKYVQKEVARYNTSIKTADRVRSDYLLRLDDPVLVAHMLSVAGEVLPTTGPQRVWIETDNTHYLECLLILWPTTCFMVCTWTGVDMRRDLERGVGRDHRLLQYRMSKPETLYTMADKYGQADDALLIVA